MLKVVGASWQKTRISTYILLGAGLLAIGGFFIAEMERPQYNGIYCATIFWSEKVGFQVEYWKQRNDLANIPKGVARTCYKDSILHNGWSQLEVETQRNYPDWVQAFGAGVLEGTLTWHNIYNQWTNTIISPCDRDENSQKFCSWLRETLSTNYNTMKEIANNRSKNDHYWHQISLFYYQLEGLEAGWIRGAKRSRSGFEDDITFVDFLIMNSAADIHDLKLYYENFIIANKTILNKTFLRGRSSMLVKLFKNELKNDEWKLLMGHSTGGSYSSMLRIQKRYKFRYHFTPEYQKSNNIPGTDITFTGYPGILGSTDDFYIIKGHKLHTIIAGVEIYNENNNLWNDINIKNIMPLTARVMVSNRLAQNQKTWQKIMSRHPYSGSKQWLQIDLKKIDYLQMYGDNKNDTISDKNGIIWLAEQIPGHFKILDITNKIITNGSSYLLNGTPYFDDILNSSGISKDNFSDNLIEETNNMTKLETIDEFLRKYAFRGDLLGVQSMPIGNIDLKLYSYDPVVGVSDYHAISGPLYYNTKHQLEQTNSLTKSINNNLKLNNDQDNLAEFEMIVDSRPSQVRSSRNDIHAIAMRRMQQHTPFKWSSGCMITSGCKHNGHPDEWNFDKVSPKWAWQD